MEDYARILASRVPEPVGSDRESLVREFKRLQSVRIHSYQHFNSALFDLVREGRLAAYSEVCSHFTSIFNDISSAVRQVRDRLETESGILARIISKIQEIEKTKLVVQTKYHMAYLSAHSSLDFSSHVSNSEEEYISKIRRLEELVNEEMDNLQSALCEDIGLDAARIS